MAGKRKISPPATERRKRAAKEKKKLLANLPSELTMTIKAVVTEQVKVIEQYKNGNEKALNAIVGAVMKKYKADPAVVRELLIREINATNSNNHLHKSISAL